MAIKMMPKWITAAWLREHAACIDQVTKFSAEWPEGGEITRAALMRAVEIGLDLDWLAQKTLTAPAWAEYQRVKAPAWAEYQRVTTPALAEYQRVTAQALAEYERVKAQALADALGLPK